MSGTGSTVDPARTSRILHGLAEQTTRPFNAVAVAALVMLSWITIVLLDFDEGAQLVFGTVSAGVILTMVFVLQHTQRREQIALQLKLNEIIRALPQASDRLVGVETSSDDELFEIGRSHVEQHASLRDDGGSDDSAV